MRFLFRVLTFPFRIAYRVAKASLMFAGASMARQAVGKVTTKVRGSSATSDDDSDDSGGFSAGKAVAVAAGVGAALGVGRMLLSDGGDS